MAEPDYEWEECDRCFGSGMQGRWEWETCPHCQGRGEVLVEMQDDDEQGDDAE